MDRKERRIGVRLSGDDLAKVEQISAVLGGNLSEAVRFLIRGRQVKTVAVIEIAPPDPNQLIRA